MPPFLTLYSVFTGMSVMQGMLTNKGIDITQILQCLCRLIGFYVETYFSFRYLLYDVNPGEGFNLRRDVYMRVTNLVKELNKEEPWVLVLPPWGRLYHWKSPDLEQIKIPWSTFFDLPSLREHVPVIEFEEYLKCMLSALYIAFFNMLYQFYSLLLFVRCP